MYREVNVVVEFYEFIGWVKDPSKFMEVVNNDINKLPTEVCKYILDETYKQAEIQAKTGTKEFPENGYWEPDYSIAYRQQRLESIAKAAMEHANKWYRTKERHLFVFGPELGGVYVFKKIL